ncbi:MAG: redoxin domain-containing protein [Chloroflexota bacterium]|nr:redoxin domain-containing protein [Chloroflexota bacterium]
MVAQRVPQADTAAGPPRSDRRGRLTQIGLGLGVALAILAGAFVAVRPDQSGLGTGGINSNLLPKVGQVAPDFEVHDLLGNPVRLSQFRGQPVWLMFWGSWCPPCRAEFPDVQRAYEQLAPEGVRLLGVSVREPWTAAAAYAVQNGVTFDVLTDETESGIDAYPLFNVPTHIFIDADGVIRSVVMADMSEQRALAEARALLQPARTTG